MKIEEISFWFYPVGSGFYNQRFDGHNGCVYVRGNDGRYSYGKNYGSGYSNDGGYGYGSGYSYGYVYGYSNDGGYGSGYDYL